MEKVKLSDLEIGKEIYITGTNFFGVPVIITNIVPIYKDAVIYLSNEMSFSYNRYINELEDIKYISIE